MLFFFPAKVQLVAGIVLLVVGLAVLHSFITAGLGVLGIAFGATRYIRSRRPNGIQR
ncbi:MAG: hypothetical protein ACRDOA_20135 [Streptosporangiaceae bacterium]